MCILNNILKIYYIYLTHQYYLRKTETHQVELSWSVSQSTMNDFLSNKSAILGHTSTSVQITPVVQVVSYQNIHKAVTEAQDMVV